MSSNTPTIIILIVLSVVGYNFLKTAVDIDQKCKRKGGVFMETAIWYECVNMKVIK